MFKKFLSIFVLTIIMMTLLSTTGFADDGISKKLVTSPITPNWIAISQFTNTFDISSMGKSTVDSVLYAFSVDKIRIDAYLQQYKNGNWVTIKSWSNTSTDISCSISEIWYVEEGYYYRLVTKGTVYRNGVQLEQANYTSDARWY
ncbi:hypothetical protein Q2T46_09190 [Thermoanaerobacterium sp. CMT5567-10]|uniref:hypothetical protein n=1 Tax=Thermoanaerobacterium sp. CMT5567-10 TaxID=3061989 RepID=UPI0026E062A7|nr:hypothetical protein [Thermoanaerobacterium sp. CMT5567-10]WKV07741.1 hypothetical protein Q2T46_09190 [Thermoanaerobacterium sp. CMT5567-10]